jgi:predicted DNA-binding transcriptional regulator AlpA
MQPTFEQLPGIVAELVSKIENLTNLFSVNQPVQREEEVIMNAKEVAAFLGCSVSTVQHSKDIPSCIRLSKRLFVKSEIIEWVRQGKQKTTDRSAIVHVRTSRKRKVA